MSSEVEPLVFLAGNNAFGSETPEWTLHVPEEDDPEATRRFVAAVRFDRFFRSLPVVHIGLTALDASNEAAARIRVRAETITLDGFEIVVETWRDSRVWAMEVSWLAVGA